MQCENCGEREATVHEVLIHQGKKVEKHLCQACAGQAGIDANPNTPINELLSKYLLKQTGEARTPESALVCPICQTTWAEFRQSGLLGCPGCYDTFAERLGPLIERAHEGGCRHVGKLPRRALSAGDGGRMERLLGDASERAERLADLRRQLACAVDAEQYERAAALRDELRRMIEISGGREVIEPEGGEV